MAVLALKLAAPMQSWGCSSRFSRRGTRDEPTKSGVVGLLAAAQGRRRSDPVEDLAALRLAVRIDQPGTLMRDFQTARSLDGTRTMPLSHRYYLADAVFTVFVEGDVELLTGLHEAVCDPVHPLYLGRRSCPPLERPSLGLVATGQPATAPADAPPADALLQAVAALPWKASDWWRRTRPAQVVLDVVRDAAAGEAGEQVRDEPLSFDPQLRRYGWRTVVRSTVTVTNDTPTPGGRTAQLAHDPFALFGDAL